MTGQQIGLISKILTRITEAYSIFKNDLSITINDKCIMILEFKYNDFCIYKDCVSLGMSEEDLINSFDEIIRKAQLLRK